MSDTTVLSIECLNQTNEDLEYAKCKMLWQAVILQAFIDLKSMGKREIDCINRTKAILWIHPDKESFKIVCDRAGFDPHYLYERKLRLMEQNPQIRKKAS